MASLLVAGTVVGTAPPASAATVSVVSLLEKLWIEPENTSAYDQSYFKRWIDANRDGCDTRQEVLKAESHAPTAPLGGGCPVTSGIWTSYYDLGRTVNPSELDISHTVSLSEAWESGAWSWSAAQREAFANDLDWPATLVLVTDDVNASKGDRDPAAWMPPAGDAECRYVSDWVTVKYRWNLSIDQVEYDALARWLYDTPSCLGMTTTVPPKAGSPEPQVALRAYITEVYNDLFGRDPDPAGFVTWTGKLQHGAPYSDVANSITASTEFRSLLITDAYQHYLGRDPDADGLQFWLAQMRSGRHIERMQAGFVASDEFYGLGGGTPSGWVTLLYQVILGRDPGPSEVAWWVNAINGGRSRASVALGFLYSTEHLATVVDGFYVSFLQRHLDPSGKTTWVGRIQAGHRDEEIIAAIVSSSEYRGSL